MAKTREQINFDYSKAIAQVNALKDVSGKVTKIANSDMQDCMLGVSKVWIGDNSDAYVSKGNKLKAKVATSGGNISKVAGTLKTMAENIKAAELESLRIVEEREAAIQAAKQATSKK